MSREIRTDQTYRDKLLKLIPTEIVAAFLVIEGIIEQPIMTGEIPCYVSWIVFAILFVLSPLYLYKIHRITRLAQVVLTTVTFAIWVYTLGGPFRHQGWHQPTIASVALVLWTLVIPLLADLPVNGESGDDSGDSDESSSAAGARPGVRPGNGARRFLLRAKSEGMGE